LIAEGEPGRALTADEAVALTLGEVCSVRV
jgi:hypothetical protein